MAAHDQHDPDREAIMARRRRFIALALGGLSTSCTPGKPGPDPTPVSTSGSGESTTSGEGSDSDGESDTEDPGEKLDLPPGEKFDLPPEPESESGSETESGGTTGPQPCLAPIGMRSRRGTTIHS
ncbi:MAG TPA: hypothetical protein VM869_32145 [Enhygromyxa sp.]|nr:hypothetical protein [Enhygromyxa sp.]